MSDDVTVRLKEMVDFFSERVSDLYDAAARMQAEPLTRELGYLLRGVGESYQQTLSWARQVLQKPMPSQNDPAGVVQWITCYRIFRRQLQTFGAHRSFDHSWFDDDPVPVNRLMQGGHLHGTKLAGQVD